VVSAGGVAEQAVEGRRNLTHSGFAVFCNNNKKHEERLSFVLGLFSLSF
jgi:hypothetical protein